MGTVSGISGYRDKSTQTNSTLYVFHQRLCGIAQQEAWVTSEPQI